MQAEFKQCFAYKQGMKGAKDDCLCLNRLFCEKEGKCSFFKTNHQIEQEQQELKARKERRA